MIQWSLVLKPVFPDVVDMVVQTSPPDLEDPYIYYDLQEKDYALTYPDSLAKLLRHLLSGATLPLHVYWCEKVGTLFRQLVGRTSSNLELMKITEQLARLGCSNASELSSLLKSE